MFRLSTECLATTMEATRHWNNIFKVLKGNDHHSKNCESGKPIF